MAQLKERGVFWVVSTHVITTGFVFPWAAGVLAVLAAGQLRLQETLTPPGELAAVMVVQALGYWYGSYYSFAYLRKTTIVRHPMACVTPSIVTFAVLAAAGAGWSISRNGPGLGLLTGMTVAYSVLVVLMLAFLTKRGFGRMAAQTAPGFEVISPTKSP